MAPQLIFDDFIVIEEGDSLIIRNKTTAQEYIFPTNGVQNSPTLNTGTATIERLTVDSEITWPDGTKSVGSPVGLPAVRSATQFEGVDGGAKIQAAVDDLPPEEGGVVLLPTEGPDTILLPDGRTVDGYLLSSTITLRSNVALWCPGTAYLHLSDTVNDDVIRTNSTGATGSVTNILVEGLYVSGNKASNTSRAANTATFGSDLCGINAYYADNVDVRRCEFREVGGDGVRAQRATDVRVENCIVADGANAGYVVTDAREASRLTSGASFFDCEARNNAGAGFEVSDGPEHVLISGCTVDGASVSSNGIRIHAPSAGKAVTSVDVVDTTLHACANSGLSILTEGPVLDRVSVSGGSFYENGQSGSVNGYDLAGVELRGSGATVTNVSLTGLRCYDDQVTATQQHAVYGSGVDDSTFYANMFGGNGTGAFGGTFGSNVRREGNIGELDSVQPVTTTQTANYTPGNNETVLVDASGGAVTITLPAPVDNLEVSVKKIDSSTNEVTIASPNTETIDGSASQVISAQYIAETVVSDGTNYFLK